MKTTDGKEELRFCMGSGSSNQSYALALSALTLPSLVSWCQCLLSGWASSESRTATFYSVFYSFFGP